MIRPAPGNTHVALHAVRIIANCVGYLRCAGAMKGSLGSHANRRELLKSGDFTQNASGGRVVSVMAMLRQQPLNSDSASVEWMEVAHEDDDVPIIGWAL
jgi:hypothetical protein